MEFKKIEISRQGTFILALLLMYFGFFGYLCAIYEKSIGESVVFLYQVMFIPGGPGFSILLFMFAPITSSSAELLSTLILIEQITFLIIYIVILIIPFICKFVLEWSTKNSVKTLLVCHIIYLFFLFGPRPLVIYFLIIFILVFREEFFEYGIRNSIWITPFIIGMTWMWYFLMNPGSNLLAIIGVYFIRIESYLTILTLLGINLITAIIASVTKEEYKKYLQQIKKIDIKQRGP